MVTLRLLGGIDLNGPSDEELQQLLAQPKRMAVLAYLALQGAGGFLRRETLLAQFWAETDEARARNALNQVLHGLRKALGKGVIQARGKSEVGLDASVFGCDVWLFKEALKEEQFADALEIYAGPLLPGFHLEGAWEFERWLEEEREGLREAAAGAAWQLAQEHIRNGALVQSERVAQRALSLVGTDETPVREFMKALSEAGDRAAALNFFQKFCSRLRVELDLEPSPLTAAVAKEIRNGVRPIPGEEDLAPHEATRPATEEASATDAGLDDLGVGGQIPDPVRAGDDAPTGNKLRLRSILWPGLLGIVVVCLYTVWVWPTSEPEPDPQDIAVAPFVNRTGDPALDDFGWLLAENIRVSLDRGEIGRVLPQPVIASALGRAGLDADPITVLPRDLGAGIVVTGEFYRQGDTLVISAYCIDAQDGRDLGSISPVRGPWEDDREVMALVQDRVSGVLAHYLEAPLPGNRVDRPPLNLEAFRANQRAWETMSGEDEETDIRVAVPLFLRAFELDTTYMEPLIRAWFLLMWWEERGDGGTSYAEKRDSLYFVLDRSRTEMSVSQSRWIDWARAEFQGPRDPQYALRTARKLSEFASTDFAFELGFSAARLNFLEEARSAFQHYDKGNGKFLEALADYNYFFDYAQVLHRLGHHEKELQILVAGQRRNPSMRPLRHLELRARVALGDLDEVDSLAQTVPRYGNWMYMVHPALLEFYGHPEKARIFLEGEVQRFETDSVYRADPLARAGVLSALGYQEEAIAIAGPLIADRPNDPAPLRMVGIAAARMGDTARARALDGRLADIPYVQKEPWARAFLAGALCEKDRALAFMKQVSPTQGGWFMWRHGRDFQCLQGYRPYEDFLRPKVSPGTG